MSKLFLLTFFLLSSCALFEKTPSLRGRPVEEVLDLIQLTGEGRGRLGLDQNQYLFSYEALVKDRDDWLLAVSVPLHGEEVMILADLRSQVADLSEPQSFEARLQREIDHRYRGLSGREYVNQLRSMVRFLLAPKLGLERTCAEEGEDEYLCLLEDDEFQLRVEKKKIFVKKNLSGPHVLELVGENLTGSFFARTNFLLHSRKGPSNAPPMMSLELFWK